jgi:recombination protein RecT
MRPPTTTNGRKPMSEQNGNGGQIQRQGGGKTVDNLIQTERFQMALRNVATRHLTPEKLTKVIISQLTRNPKLAQCTPMSIMNSMLVLAELGLTPGPLGDAYLIPYNNTQARVMECQLIIGYRGLVRLAYRSGEIASVEARVVYRQDEFSIDYGIDSNIVHRLNLDGPMDNKDIIGAYLVAKLKEPGTSPVIEFMSRQQIEAIRSRSRASGSGPWVTDFAEMCRKTVARRGCKWLPLTPEVMDQISKVDEVEFGGALDLNEMAGDSPARAIIEEAEEQAPVVNTAQARVSAAADVVAQARQNLQQAEKKPSATPAPWEPDEQQQGGAPDDEDQRPEERQPQQAPVRRKKNMGIQEDFV